MSGMCAPSYFYNTVKFDFPELGSSFSHCRVTVLTFIHLEIHTLLNA